MTDASATQPRSLRPFLTLWVGQVFSLLGSQLVQFSLIWWLTQQTGSATVLAVASIVGLVPQVVLGPFVGPLVDRWNRKRTMILADAAVALATLGLALLFWLGQAELWHVYAILFVRALGGTFHGPAITASVSLMVPPEHLTRVQGLNQMLNGGLNIISAPLGALLLQLLPLQGVLMIDLVTAAIAITTVLLVRVPQPQHAETTTGSAVGQYWQDLRAGFRYVLSWRGLLILMGMAMLINLVLSPSMSFIPLLVTEHFEGTAWHLSAMEAALGIGVLVGGVLLGAWGGFKSRVYTSLLGLIGLGLSVLLAGVVPSSLFALAVLAMGLMGLMSSLTNGPIMAVLQAAVAPSMQGRVFTLLSSAAMAMMPLGLAVAGPLADVMGVRAWFVVGGLLTLAMGVGGYFIPSLVNIEAQSKDHLEPVGAPDVARFSESRSA
ncbi:MAG: MFS transporter [Candidatus Promineofilum sp.]|nr:MFS transporter [Promineifilum sp.]